MINFSKQFTINLTEGKVACLKKGMTKQEVITILGNPVKIENCKNICNEKLVFKINGHQVVRGSTYTLLFTREQLVYVAKVN
ncbi:hypothetical protein CNR22_02120 [Sphingobacteriaceae bacterium]|nr:hypothetical protein CNR22_02120 [Sphingobacteriaceae bacterium]